MHILFLLPSLYWGRKFPTGGVAFPVTPTRHRQDLSMTAALEDPAIRADVCEILEGGTAAVLERAKRLRMATPTGLR